jgi:hypothetical protein
MGLGFLPNRESMCSEVEKWTALKNIDTLQRLCNSCVYKAFDIILAQECRMCVIRKGILWIQAENQREKLVDDRLITAC